MDIINASAPYEVYWHETSRTCRFKSDFGVVLAIGFDDDDIIENAESYVFSIINVNKIPSPRDLKMRDTVMLIIENFFNITKQLSCIFVRVGMVSSICEAVCLNIGFPLIK